MDGCLLETAVSNRKHNQDAEATPSTFQDDPDPHAAMSLPIVIGRLRTRLPDRVKDRVADGGWFSRCLFHLSPCPDRASISVTFPRREENGAALAHEAGRGREPLRVWGTRRMNSNFSSQSSMLPASCSRSNDRYPGSARW